jgi:peptidoglycan/xylan/chitin deacetylase (PgdA/CDA1 family)
MAGEGTAKPVRGFASRALFEAEPAARAVRPLRGAGRVMLAALKQTALRVSRSAGLSATIGNSAWRRGRLLILCYHGISLYDEHEWDPLLYVSETTFSRRLDLIRQLGCAVMPLGEALSRLYSGDLPSRALVITFDDGYVDFARRARPALKRHGFPATVYLTTQRCEHNFPIARLLSSYVLWKRRDRVLDGRELPGLEARRYPLASAGERRIVLERFSTGLAPMRPADKDAAVRALALRLGLDYDALRADRLLTIMNPAEVTAAAAAGVDFQLHTHRHRTPDDPAAFAEEIATNRDRILEMTGVRPTHFCYPSGYYQMSFLPRLRQQGVESATTSNLGLADPAHNPLLLPRVLDSEMVSDEEFAGWLTGASAWLPRRGCA